MSTSVSQSTYDLSDLSSWRGLRPGMMRDDVQAVLNEMGVDATDWDADEESILVADGWNVELVFDETQRLYQVALEDGQMYGWAGRPVLDVPLHEALLAMQPMVAGAGWRREDAVTDPFEELMEGASLPAGPMGDAALLNEGTLWLPVPGLALMMCGGRVCEIAWREPGRVPRPFVSPVTAAQLELSQRPDLEEHLLRLMTREHRAAAAQRNPLQGLVNWLFLAAVVALGVVLLHAVQEYRNAPLLTGRFVRSEWVQGKIREEVYHVEYTDPAGHGRTGTLKRADFYVAPREPGEQMQFRFLAGAEPVLHGLSRGGAPVFEKFAPWLAALAGGYVLLSLGVRVVGGRRMVKHRS